MSRSYGPGRYDRDYEEHGRDLPAGYVRWTEQRNMQAFLDLVAAGRVEPVGAHDAPLPDRRCRRGVPRRSPTRRSGERAFGVLLTYEERAEPSVAPAAPRARRSTETAGVAVIGAGGFARATLIPALREEGARLVAVATSRGLSAADVASRFGFERAAVVRRDPRRRQRRRGRHRDPAREPRIARRRRAPSREGRLRREAARPDLGAARGGRERRCGGLGAHGRLQPPLRPARRAAAGGARTGRRPRSLHARQRRPAPRRPLAPRSRGRGRTAARRGLPLRRPALPPGRLARRVGPRGRGAAAWPADRVQRQLHRPHPLRGTQSARSSTPAAATPGCRRSGSRRSAGARRRCSTTSARSTVHRGGKRREWKSSHDKGHRAEIRRFLAAVAGEAEPPPARSYLDSTRLTLALAGSLRTGRPVDMSAGADQAQPEP